MADQIDPLIPGPIIELGSGTGAITKALLEHGIDQTRLILIESHREFFHNLSLQYEKAHCYCDDAYELDALARKNSFPQAAAIISGLPLRTESKSRRRDLILAALRLLKPGAPFIQFSYGIESPINGLDINAEQTAVKTIWKNIPPARIWVYRRQETSC